MDRLTVINAESDRFAAVLAECAPEARVPSCPDWNARDLLWHLTQVHQFWAGVLSSGARTEEEVRALERQQRPDSLDELLARREEATGALVGQLAARADDEPAWSWFEADQSVGFTRRMQTYEATIHRVDAEQAAGIEVTPIAPDVAAGAVDHCVDVMWWGWAPEGARYQPLSVVELVATDTGQRWSVQLGHCVGESDGERYDLPRATRAESGTPVATVSAAVADLALWAWTRGDAVHLEGDDAGVQELTALIDHGIQ